VTKTDEFENVKQIFTHENAERKQFFISNKTAQCRKRLSITKQTKNHKNL